MRLNELPFRILCKIHVHGSTKEMFIFPNIHDFSSIVVFLCIICFLTCLFRHYLSLYQIVKLCYSVPNVLENFLQHDFSFLLLNFAFKFTL